MAYTLPPIAVTGEIITAAWGNDVRTALATLKKGLTSDVGSYRATLNGTAAVDTGIARPTLQGSGDNWALVNFGDSVGPLRDADRIGRGGNSGNITTVPVTGQTRVPVSTGSQNPFSNKNLFLHFGSSMTFAGVSIDFVSVTSVSNVQLAAEYWNGSAWSALSVSDGTDDGGSFRQDGEITWTAPSDWAQNAVQSGGTRYWVRFKAATSTSPRQVTWASARLIGTSATDGLSRDAEWPLIRINDLHDTEICPAVSAGDALDRSNSLVFADAVADGEDAYLAVLSNGNLAIAVGAAGVHALPFTIKTLNANALA